MLRFQAKGDNMAKNKSGLGFNVFEFKGGIAKKIFEYKAGADKFKDGIATVEAKFGLDVKDIHEDMDRKLKKMRENGFK